MPGGRALQPAVDVAGADDDATSTPRSCTALICARDRLDALGVGAVVEGAHQGLAGQLQQDPLNAGRLGVVGHPRVGSGLADGEAREAPDDDVLAGAARRARRAAARWSCRRTCRALTCTCLSSTTSSSHLRELAARRSCSRDVLGLVGDLLLVDAQLGVLDVLGHVVLGDPARSPGWRRCAARRRGRTRRSRRSWRRSRCCSRPRPARRPCRWRGCRTGRCPRWPRGRRAWRLVAHALHAQELDGLLDVAVGLLSAFLQSIIPAPVRSRRALTSFAEIVGVLTVCSL